MDASQLIDNNAQTHSALIDWPLLCAAAPLPSQSQRSFSEPQCLAFLCRHLQRQLSPNGSDSDNAATTDYDAMRTPLCLHALLIDLGDTLVRIGSGAGGTLTARSSTCTPRAADQGLHLLCTLLQHPEPMARLLTLQVLKDPRALHALVVSGPRAGVAQLQRLLLSCWHDDEASALRTDVLEVWEALFATLLRPDPLHAYSPAGLGDGPRPNPHPHAHLEWAVRTCFDELVLILSHELTSAPASDATLPSVSVAAAAAHDQEMSARALTLSSDPHEWAKLRLLSLLSLLLREASSPTFSSHVHSNHDLVFYLLLEALKRPQGSPVQRAIFRVLEIGRAHV